MKKLFITVGLIFSGLILSGCDQPSSGALAGFTMSVSSSQVVTFDEYRKVQTGMSYRQVVRIIGTEGEELSRNYIEGVPEIMAPVETVMYQWVNINGSNMNVIFQNDRLIQKAQFGLR